MKIKFLIDKYFGNSAGEVVDVEEETELEYYYYDGFDRWCFVDRDKEDIEFEIVEE
jgi:hypothetical protein